MKLDQFTSFSLGFGAFLSSYQSFLSAVKLNVNSTLLVLYLIAYFADFMKVQADATLILCEKGNRAKYAALSFQAK
jgi:hypothetical protein